MYIVFMYLAEANATIQRLNNDNASGASAAVGVAEAETRQLKEEVTILHKVVAGRILVVCVFRGESVLELGEVGHC